MEENNNNNSNEFEPNLKEEMMPEADSAPRQSEDHDFKSVDNNDSGLTGEYGEPGNEDEVLAEEEQDPSNPGNPGPAKGSSKVWQIVSLVLAILLVVVLIKPPFATNKAEAVATVNGVEITKDKLYDELAKSGGEQALTNLINQELVNQEAQKKNISITDADIDKEIESYKTQFGSEEGLQQALTQYGMSMDDLRNQVGMELKLTKLLEPQIKVTDDQIKQTFDTNKASFNTPEQVRTSIIVVKTEQEAKDIIEQLKGGADFAELAKSKSIDTTTKDLGGDTNFFGRGEKEKAVEDASFKLAKGEISGAVKTSMGYEVIKLTDHKEAHTATLDEKKEEIRKGLVSQQVSSLSQGWLDDARNKAKITNTLADNKTGATEPAANEAPAQ